MIQYDKEDDLKRAELEESLNRLSQSLVSLSEKVADFQDAMQSYFKVARVEDLCDEEVKEKEFDLARYDVGLGDEKEW